MEPTYVKEIKRLKSLLVTQVYDNERTNAVTRDLLSLIKTTIEKLNNLREK